QGVMRVWLMTEDQGYRLSLVHVGPDGCGWQMAKWSDGTRYHLFEADGAVITCDCPGATPHGPHRNGGKGCKHAPMLPAPRQVVDPGLWTKSRGRAGRQETPALPSEGKPSTGICTRWLR